MTAATTRKPVRRRLARAELWLQVATDVERLRASVLDEKPGVLPFAEWPDDDPLRVLCARYDLTPTDVARELDRIGEELERKAYAAGYEEAWVE